MAVDNTLFGYTPATGNVQTFSPDLRVESRGARIAGELTNLLGARQKSLQAEEQRLQAQNKEQQDEFLNYANIELFDQKSRLLNDISQTNDFNEREKLYQKYYEDSKLLADKYNLNSKQRSQFVNSVDSDVSKMWQYNSNAKAKYNDNVRANTMALADEAVVDPWNPNNTDYSLINNNKKFRIQTQYGGKAKGYYDSLYSNFATKALSTLGENPSPEMVDTLLKNLDTFSKGVGDKISINNQDAVVGSNLFTGYHETRNKLINMKQSSMEKLKGTLSKYEAGGDKSSYISTLDRLKENGYFNDAPELYDAYKNSFDVKQTQANKANIVALKNNEQVKLALLPPESVITSYRSNGGKDEQWVYDYKKNWKFNQTFTNNPTRFSLTDNPEQAKKITDFNLKNLLGTGQFGSAIKLVSDTGYDAPLKDYIKQGLSSENPEQLQQMIPALMQMERERSDVMSNAISAEDKSKYMYLKYLTNTGKVIDEATIQRMSDAKVAYKSTKVSSDINKDFNSVFGTNPNRMAKYDMLKSLVAHGMEEKEALKYVQEDFEGNRIGIKHGWTGLIGSQKGYIDLNDKPGGKGNLTDGQIAEAFEPFLDVAVEKYQTSNIGFIYNSKEDSFFLQIEGQPPVNSKISWDKMIQYQEIMAEARATSAWGNTKRQIGTHYNNMLNALANKDEARLAEQQRQLDALFDVFRGGIRTNGEVSPNVGTIETQSTQSKTVGELMAGIKTNGKPTAPTTEVPEPKKGSLEELQVAYSDDNINWKEIGLNKTNPITGLSGTIAHRNNNPGAMKLEFAGAILGNTVSPSNMRSRQTAIKKAKELYDGVITLDRAGFIVFDSVESGKKAQIQLLVKQHKGRTIEEMLPKYAIADGSGNTHHKEYATAIYNYADSKGIDLKNKKIGEMSPKEVKVLASAMARVEGGVS